MEPRIKRLGERIHDAMVKHGEFGNELGGSCAVCSHLLVAEAKKRFGIDMQFCAVYGHAWAEYKGVIYDVTATQFGEKPKVVICHRSKIDETIKSGYLAKCYKRFPTDPIPLAKVNEEWPDYQKPANYNLRRLNQYAVKVLYKEK